MKSNGLVCRKCRAIAPWTLSSIHTWGTARPYSEPTHAPRAVSLRGASKSTWERECCWRNSDRPTVAHVPDVDLGLAFAAPRSPNRPTLWGTNTVRTGTSAFDRWHGNTPKLSEPSVPPAERARFDAVVAAHFGELVGLATHLLRHPGRGDDDSADLQPDSIVKESIIYALTLSPLFKGDDENFLSHVRSIMRNRVKQAIQDRRTRRKRFVNMSPANGEADDANLSRLVFEPLGLKPVSVVAARRQHNIESALALRLDVARAIERVVPEHRLMDLWTLVVEDISRAQMVAEYPHSLGDSAWRYTRATFDDLRKALADYAQRPVLRQNLGRRASR